MKKEDTYDFLLRAAIPSIDDSKRLPEDLRRERGKKKENGINVIALFLYTTITDYSGELSSEYLINELLNKYEDSGIGVIQKLVNMTLKYMLILQLFDKLDGYIIAESSCDCPLDSRILDSLGMSDLKWTKDFNASNREESKKNYDIIQGKIAKRQKGQSKLAYDFANWQSF